jgi:hypothetical protein
MFEKLHTHILKNVIAVCYGIAELDGNRIDQTPVALDQGFPGERVAA